MTTVSAVAMSKDKEMGLLEHLEEMRWRIIISVLTVSAIAVFGYIFRNWILGLLTEPIAQYYQFPVGQLPAMLDGIRDLLSDSGKFTPEQLDALVTFFHRGLRQLTSLTFIHPTEAFISYIKLAFYTGLLVGAPMLLFQLWRFILPALYDNERRYFLGAFTVGSLLFYAGVVFSYVVVFPFVIQFLINLGENLTATLTVSNYISFSMMFMLVFGLVFELPVLIFLAVRSGLTTVAFLSQKRRYIYVIVFVVGAIVTPPDVVSQLAVAVPMVVLFEASLIFSRITEGKRQHARQAQQATEDAPPADET